MSKRLLGTLTLSFGLALLGAATTVVPSALHAQTNHPTSRVVEGHVEDADGKPVENAVVYLKDTKTLAIKSYLTDSKGYFHFTQLSLSTDYDVWAELNGAKSKPKSISMFNAKPMLTYTLKLGS